MAATAMNARVVPARTASTIQFETQVVPILDAKKIGDVITYAEIDAVGRDHRRRVEHYMRRRRNLLVENEKNVGWHVCGASGGLREATRHSKKALRATRREGEALTIVSTADITPEQQRVLDFKRRGVVLKLGALEEQRRQERKAFGGKREAHPRLTP